MESDSLSPSPEVQQTCTLLQGWHGLYRLAVTGYCLIAIVIKFQA